MRWNGSVAAASAGAGHDAPRRHLKRVVRDPDPRTPLPDWVAAIPAVRQLLDLPDGWQVPAGVTVLVGENGSGKSTIVEALAASYPRLPMDRTGPGVGRDEAPLARHLTCETDRMAARGGFFLRAEAMHGYLRAYDESIGESRPDRGETPVLNRSHGEGFLWVLQEHFAQAGVFFLDEPEAALSFSSCLGLLSLLDTLASEGSQVIMATHSPLLAALPGATVYQLDDDGMHETPWQELDLVTQWRGFLSAPQRFLRHLLD